MTLTYLSSPIYTPLCIAHSNAATLVPPTCLRSSPQGLSKCCYLCISCLLIYPLPHGTLVFQIRAEILLEIGLPWALLESSPCFPSPICYLSSLLKSLISICNFIYLFNYVCVCHTGMNAGRDYVWMSRFFNIVFPAPRTILGTNRCTINICWKNK